MAYKDSWARSPTSQLDLPGSFPETTNAPVSTQASLNKSVWARRREFTTTRSVRIKVGTWNVAAIPGTEKDVAGWFVHGKGVSEALSGLGHTKKPGSSEVESIEEQETRRTPKEPTIPKNDKKLVPGDKDIGLYVLGLQEIVDLSSPTETLRPFHDKAPSERWKSAMLVALPKGYQIVAEQQLLGMYLLIYAAADVAPAVSNVSCRSVGTGLWGYMGNKGAVSARIVLGETTRVVFINSHLSAGAEKQNLERRNSDADQIVRRTRFDPIDRGQGVVDEVGEGIGDEDFAFWFGDLNYRLADLPGNDIRRLLMLHTRKQYEEDRKKQAGPRHDNAEASDSQDDAQSEVSDDVEIDPDQDPASMQTTIASLLPHDELHEQMRKCIAFHEGWQEGQVRFMPTYKYDIGSVGMFDSSEKKRAPSWCDRILYRTRKNYLEYLEREKGRGKAQSADGVLQAEQESKSQALNYSYDPDVDADEALKSANVVTTRTGVEGEIELEYYTAHQRVLSSDHKPLHAVFRMTYQAVDVTKKQAIYQEVSRDFDRMENESRPKLAVAVDTSEGQSSEELVDFGELRIGELETRTVTVANTGMVPATFGFIDQAREQKARSWLSVSCDQPPLPTQSIPNSFGEYRIEPGDALTSIITVRLLPEDVRSFNSLQLEDVLILRVFGGRDHFLTVHGRWKKEQC